jgi:hypothetical protein
MSWWRYCRDSTRSVALPFRGAVSLFVKISRCRIALYGDVVQAVMGLANFEPTALAAIKGDRTLAQLAEQFDIHPSAAGPRCCALQWRRPSSARPAPPAACRV